MSYRIAIVGTSGSGKTTLARQVAEILDIPHIELDALFWKPNWEQSDTWEFFDRIEAATQGDNWVVDGNYRNRNELLLGHHYNGVMLDIEQAKRTLERVFDLWGRPVNLKTIVKEFDEHDVEVARRRDREPTPEEKGKLVRYDGESFETVDLPWEDVEDIAATDVDYDTKPDDWL